MFGIALCASSAAAINQVIDRKTDASMTRTDQRPLPKGELSVMHASIFAMTIGVIGALILFFYVNTLTMLLTIASLICYAFIYTVYLKRATPQNIVIGGLAGAAPPLLGWSSVTNTIDPYALLLVLIIFVWTPPHFWALAIYRKDEYAKESRRLANTYPENVAIFQFPDLFKSLEMQEKMLTFVGIPRDVQVLGPLERVNSKEFRDKMEKKKAALLRITTQNIPSDSGDAVRHEKKKSYKMSKFATANRKGSP